MLSEKSVDSPSQVVIQDNRSEESKSLRIDTSGVTARFYGDSNFVPDRILYLSVLINRKVESEQQVTVNLQEFEIIEYIPKTVAKGVAFATAGAMNSIPGVIYTGNPYAAGQGKHDSLVIYLKGDIQGKPFDFSLSTITDDISYFSFPHENPKFHELTRSMFSEAADRIVTIYNRVAEGI